MSRLAAARNQNTGTVGHEGGGSLRWLLTYADMITLLMAFFIMLYSMSILNLSKFREVAVSVRSGFGGVAEGQGTPLPAPAGRFAAQPSAVAGDTAGVPYSTIRQIQDGIRRRALEGKVQMFTDERGLVLRLPSDALLFEPGSSRIRTNAIPLLADIADALRQIPNAVRVEGHTCNLPISTQMFPSNWELSTSRATEVVRHLISRERMPPARLSAAGYADQHPAASNATEAGRSANRRVDIVILRPNPMQGPVARERQTMNSASPN